MFIERIENKKIRHLDELFDKEIDDWQLAKAFVEDNNARHGREFGLIAIVRHAGGGPWQSRYEHCHNVLADRDTFEKMVAIARKYEQTWLSDYCLEKKEQKSSDNHLLLENLFKDCGEHCNNHSHYYVLTCCFAGGFYNSERLSEGIVLIKELQLEKA
jgi:hypothetical protein